MNQKSEHDIHEIIKNYPYLLEEGLENLTITHEKIYQDRTRADFVFEDENHIIVVEIKKNFIDIEAIAQALNYLDNEKKQKPHKILKGILVGNYISNTLKNEVNESEYKFDIKLLDIDVPTQIKICDKCRKANSLYRSLCKYCGHRKFIIDPFLFIVL